MDQAPKMVEVWKNVAKGMRWYTRFDIAGRETDGKVMGGRTFTLTPFERQINQEKAATADLDLFRNGTFVLVREAAETQLEEIRSSSSLTQSEIESLVLEIMAEPEQLDSVLAEIADSPTTLDRFKEFAIAHGLDQPLVEKIEAAFHEADGSTVAVRRRVVGQTEVLETAAPAE
jgi:hypothetical protein